MSSETEDTIANAIDAAEDIHDPLEGLVEKATADPGAAFMPEVLERLAALKKEDRAAFEALRSKLKKAGCRVTALDDSGLIRLAKWLPGRCQVAVPGAGGRRCGARTRSGRLPVAGDAERRNVRGRCHCEPTRAFAWR